MFFPHDLKWLRCTRIGVSKRDWTNVREAFDSLSGGGGEFEK
jgi:hypothetical protein